MTSRGDLRKLSRWVLDLRMWILVGLCCRFAYLLEQSANSATFFVPVLDEKEAVQTAKRLLAGDGYGDGPFFKAPGYATVLALVMKFAGDGCQWMMRAVQHVGGVLLIAVGYDCARRLSRGSQLAGASAAAAIALYGPLIRLESRLVLDFYVVFWQSLLLWAMIRALGDFTERRVRWMWTAGVFAAIAWLFRPTLLPLLPIIALTPMIPDRDVFINRKVKATLVAALVVPLVVVCLGSGVRNFQASGEWMVNPWQGGYNLYHANRAGANGRYYVQDRFLVGGQHANPTYHFAQEDFYDRTGRAPGSAGFREINRWWMTRTVEEVSHSPGDWLVLMIKKGIYLGSAKEIYNFEDYRTAVETSAVLPIAWIRAGWVFPLALASLVFWRTYARRPFFVLLLYTLLLAGLIALFYTSGRMRMPLVFPWAVLAGAGLSNVVSASMVRRLMYGVLCLCGLIWTYGDWWGVRSEDHRASDYARMSEAASRLQRGDQALRYVERVEQLNPSFIRLEYLRGNAYQSKGDTDSAIAAYRKAMPVFTAEPAVAFNLGILLWSEKEDLSGAETAMREAIARDPQYMSARAILARVELVRDNLDAAWSWLEPGVQAKSNNRRLLVSLVLYYRASRQDEIARGVETYAIELFGGAVRDLVSKDAERISRMQRKAE